MESMSNHKQDRQGRRLTALGPLQVIAMALLLAVAFGSTATVRANSQSELEALKTATAKYQSVDAAMDAGYKPFMDCFDNPGVGGMGYHYVNGDLMDLKVEALAPEAMVYARDAAGKMQLVGVEYIVPAKEWDAAHNEMPSLYGRMFHLNEKLGVHVLHAWVWEDNPTGVYEDWNPRISACTLQLVSAGMPRTGSVDILPAAAVAISTMLLLLGIYARRRTLRPQ
jgi:hypothetical protein